MTTLIEQIKLKADSIPTNTKENRRVKGAYVDCLMMAKESNKNFIKPGVSDSLLDEAAELLKDYEQWEGDIISEDKLWWPNRAEDVMRGKIYDKMIELQEKRNNLLKRLNCL